jgi:hypothetical protein
LASTARSFGAPFEFHLGERAGIILAGATAERGDDWNKKYPAAKARSQSPRSLQQIIPSARHSPATLGAHLRRSIDIRYIDSPGKVEKQ